MVQVSKPSKLFSVIQSNSYMVKITLIFVGIAVYRILIFKNAWIIANFGKWCTMLVIQFTCCLLSLVVLVLSYEGVKPKATFVYSCFKAEDPNTVSDSILPQLVNVAIGTSLTVMEVLIYCHIMYELYIHDKLMKLVLRPEAVKKRMRKNAVDLLGHMCQFLLEITSLVILLCCVKYSASESMFAPALFAVAQTGIIPVLHIAMSPAKQEEIKSVLTKIMAVFRRRG